MLKKYYSPFNKAFLALLLFFTSCIDPYTKQFTGEEPIFIVDGRLTNETNGNFIKLTQAVPASNGTHFLPVEEASVNVLIDGSQMVNLTETDFGYYTFPSGFKGEIGSTYQLQFSSASGKYFESRAEEMMPSPEITNVTNEFDPEAVKTTDGSFPGQRVYVDTKDAADVENFYMWDWKLYEKQQHCISCENGYYYRDATTPPNGECRTIRFRRGWFDYYCDSPCWEIISSNKINIMKDDFSNGKEIKDRLVAEFPVYGNTGSVIEVKQYGISKAVYDFLKLAQAQGQNTGGLADTPPATLSGNIGSPDAPDQAVAGYFIVSSVSTAFHWIDAADFPLGTRAIGLFGGRNVREEPISNDTTRPPLAPCLVSEERTNLMPVGWGGPNAQ